MASIPENLPSWGRIAAQWIVIGIALGLAYFDIRDDVSDFKSLAASMNTNLTSINQRISNLDVTEDRLVRLQDDVRALQNWQRIVLERERAGRPQ